MAGAPLGNKNATRAKRWQEAIDKALKRFNRAKVEGDAPQDEVKAGEALDHIAMTVVAAAIDGDWWAVAEIGNRLDGKPPQSIDITGEITHVRELTDAQLIERLERARNAGGTLEETPGPSDPGEVH